MGKYKLSDFETHIISKARSFAKRTADVEDFEQIGRLAVYQALLDDPTATKSYVHQRIEWRMIDFYNRVLYKNKEELSANEMFGNQLWGEYVFDEN